jgi:hypothetical protein
MRDLRDSTRRALRLAAGEDAGEPDLAGLRAAVPEILRHAAAERARREGAAPATTLDDVIPLGSRLLPALAAAAASLALVAWLLGGASPTAAEDWEVSMVAQAADEAQASELVAEELLP